MITLARLDMVRNDSRATADELFSLQTQLNAIFDRIQKALDEARVIRDSTQLTVGPSGTAENLPLRPVGYIEILIDGTSYVLPFYAKA